MTYIQKKNAALSASSAHLSALAPITSSLLSARLGFPIVIEKLSQQLSSAQLVSDLARHGVSTTELPLRLYNEGSVHGKPRKLDNSDCITGKENLYPSMEQFLDIYSSLEALIKEMLAFYKPKEASDMIASMELQDLDKVTMQQWKAPGWHVQMPFSPDQKADLGPEALSAIDRVVARYRKALGNDYSQTADPNGWKAATLEDSDPPTTLTGMPAMASGDLTLTTRLTTLKAWPSPLDYEPEMWVNACNSLGASLSLPPNVVFSTTVATRLGPLRKPANLFAITGGGYQALYSSVSAVNRVRFVYPIPYPINFLLSSIYVSLSDARRRILGLWHDPESMDRYLPKLKSQGSIPWSIDFSGMDTTMSPGLILAINAALVKHDFYSMPLNKFSALYPKIGILMPSLQASPSTCTFLQGKKKPWPSGMKLTSEYDTIFGASVLLSVLDVLRPGTFDEWERGEFMFCELGDDIMFTANWEVDPDQLTKLAKDMWGADLKIMKDAIFLKKFMPVIPSVPKLTRPLARFIQQTFFNEDSYTGIKGGDRPDAIMRIALSARMESLSDHRDFHLFWPKIFPIVAKLGYMERSPSTYVKAIETGKPTYMREDILETAAYSAKVPDYLAKLLDRAKFEPSAAAFVRTLEAEGLSFDLSLPGPEVRKLLLEAFLHTPNAKDLQELQRLITYVR